MDCLYGVGRGLSVHEISYLSERLGGVGYMRSPCCYQATSKLFIVKSMVGIVLYLVCCVITLKNKIYNVQ